MTPNAKKLHVGEPEDAANALGFDGSEEEDKRRKLDRIVAKAQASYQKTINQSPFGNKKAPMPNDSLDAMRLDFLADYNNIMKDGSDEFGGDSAKKYLSGLKHSQTDKARNNQH